MARVKVCGITNSKDAQAAVRYGADALGFIFVRKSPRYIEPAEAAKIIATLPPFITTVGVFVDSPLEEVQNIIQETKLSVAQLHGDETTEFCSSIGHPAIKAIRLRDSSDIDLLARYRSVTRAVLLDAYSPVAHGGTGQVCDWSLAQRAVADGYCVVLAGGLTPENVAEAITCVRPYAVDVSSGVEASPGVKDHNKLKAFIQIVKA